ncbi:MAG: peptidoglycan bridge formation glycyltransferase FemA/FemB family protein [Eubacteriales bacterium]|nr:peptidoglycan bridge formation glycyltransferase FemA/FemB family protein [Eubacteriales bacterium]
MYLEDETGEIIAALSILSVKNDGVNSFLYAQRGPVCDLSDIDLVERLLAEAGKVVQQRQGFLLRLTPAVPYSQELLDLYASRGYNILSSEDPGDRRLIMPHYNMMMDISGKTEDDVIELLSSRVRRYIRSTYRNGVSTAIFTTETPGYTEALQTLHELMGVVAARHGIAYRPLDYLDRLMRNFEHARLFQTSAPDGEVLSASIVIYYNGISTYLYTGSSNNQRELRPGYQMNYESMKYTLRQGGWCYDLGPILSFDKTDSFEAFKFHFSCDEPTRYIGQMDLIFDDDLYQDFIGS